MEKTYAMKCSEGHIHLLKNNLSHFVDDGVITKFEAKHFDFNTLVEVVDLAPSSNKCHMEREEPEEPKDEVIEYASVASIINQGGWKKLSPVASLFRVLSDDGEDDLFKVLLSLGEIQVLSYVGTGSTDVFIKKSFYERVKERNPHLAKFERSTPGLGNQCSVNGSAVKPKIEKISCIEFSFADLPSPRRVYRMPVLIMEDLSVEILLGTAWLQGLHEFKLLFGQGDSKLDFSDPISLQRFTVPIRSKSSIEKKVFHLPSVTSIIIRDGWKKLNPVASLLLLSTESNNIPKVLLSFGEVQALGYIANQSTHVFIKESFYKLVKEKNPNLAEFERSTPKYGDRCTVNYTNSKPKIEKISCVEFSFGDLQSPHKTYLMPVFIMKDMMVDVLLGMSMLEDFDADFLSFGPGAKIQFHDPITKQPFEVPIRTKCSIEDPVIELPSVADIYKCDWKKLSPQASLIRIVGVEDTLPKVLLSFGEIQTLAYMGSATTHVFINESFYERMKKHHPYLRIFEKSTPGLGRQCSVTVGGKLKIDKISCVEFSFADLDAPRKIYRMPVFIVKNLSADLLLGLMWFSDFGGHIPLGKTMDFRDPVSNQPFEVPIRYRCSIDPVIELPSVADIYKCDWKKLSPQASLIRIVGVEDTLPKVLLSFGEIQTLAYMGSATTHVFINESFYERMKKHHPYLRIFEKSTPGLGRQCSVTVGGKLKIDKISCVEFSFADLEPPRKIYRMSVFIAKDLSADLLLGLSWFDDFGSDLPFGRGETMDFRDPVSKQRFTIPIRRRNAIEA